MGLMGRATGNEHCLLPGSKGIGTSPESTSSGTALSYQTETDSAFNASWDGIPSPGDGVSPQEASAAGIGGKKKESPTVERLPGVSVFQGSQS